MNVLLIGSGGREHALAWKLAQSPGLGTLFAAPGNPGIAAHARIVTVDVANHAAVVAFCAESAVELVVIGPEAPLVAGLGDDLRVAGIAVFGPSAAAAQLEGSKGFTKDLCTRAGIPTARYLRVASRAEGQTALEGFPDGVVVKADGLAAGKGVTVAATRDEAEAALDAIFADSAGMQEGEAVLEEVLTGEEVSLFVLTDGKTLVPFGSAQDHKRVGDGDTGPNTGGMGAYSPATVLTPALERQAIDTIVRPTVDAMRAAGMPFSGVLYAGLMLTPAGPQLIEYNARFGDPECQVLMMRFEGDLLALLYAVATGTLDDAEVRFADRTALSVIMAARGYPGVPEAGGAIGRIDAAEATGATVFQAGTRDDAGTLRASGGRVLAVTACADDIARAREAAYLAVDALDFPDGFCRRDIGWREIARSQ